MLAPFQMSVKKKIKVASNSTTNWECKLVEIVLCMCQGTCLPSFSALLLTLKNNCIR